MVTSESFGYCKGKITEMNFKVIGWHNLPGIIDISHDMDRDGVWQELGGKVYTGRNVGASIGFNPN